MSGVLTATGRSKVAGTALTVYGLFLLVILLVPDGGVPSTSVGWVARVAEAMGLPGWFLDPTRFEFVCNVLIFIPVTALAAWVWQSPKWWVWAVGGFVFSACVELIQTLFLPGRSGSLVDVVANTLGALIGAVTAALLQKYSAESRRSLTSSDL